MVPSTERAEESDVPYSISASRTVRPVALAERCDHQEERILNRVQDLVAAGTDTGERVLAVLDQFESWASAHGVVVDCFYPERTVKSTGADEEFTAVSLPVVAMAEYVDGQLHHVTPHEGGTVQTVLDRLDALDAESGAETDERVARLA